jgi:hypothetical protein
MRRGAFKKRLSTRKRESEGEPNNGGKAHHGQLTTATRSWSSHQAMGASGFMDPLFKADQEPSPHTSNWDWVSQRQ